MNELLSPNVISVPANLSSEELAVIFRRLRALKAQQGFKPNKHVLATLLIEACIEEGFDTEKRITGTLKKLGLNGRHIGMILTSGTGDDPLLHHWKRLEDGRYTSHGKPSASAV